jgi:NADH dehydrogenase
MAKRYHIDPSLVTLDLIESNPRVLCMLPPAVSKRAEARLRKLKVNIYTNRTLQAQDLDNITASGMTLRSSTVIWTAGTKINEAFNSLPLDSKKRVLVNADFTLPNDQNVFVIGDGVSIVGAGLAQGAIIHGAYVGKVIVARINNKSIKPLKLKTFGYLVPVGHNWSVFSYKGVTISGFIPWLMRSFVDFHYFTTIVSWKYVFEIFRQGKKYRKDGVHFYD